MKKGIMVRVLAFALTMLFSVCLAEAVEQPMAAPSDLITVAGLDAMRAALASGEEMVYVRYTDVTMHTFITENPKEMQALWDALEQIQVVSEVRDGITDWYPQIYFTLSDGSEYEVQFNGNPVYELTGDEVFWGLVNKLSSVYEEGEAEFLSLTGFDRMQDALRDGKAFASVYYTDGYEYTSEFTTTDRSEMWALWDALRSMRVVAEAEQGMTDSYGQICFTLSDGSQYRMRFEGDWLRVDSTNYELMGDRDFRHLTRQLVEAYMSEAEE